MFGKKKTLNQPLNPSINDVSERTSQSDNNNNQINDDEQYIYFNENKEEDYFISQLEIYVKPNNYPDKEILVVVKQETTFEELYSQIEKNFKALSEFKTISKLKITNFSKKFAETGIKLPLTGPIDQHLKSGDIILCDILSEEIWLKTKFKFETKNFIKILQVEYKIPKRLKFKQIELILFKAGLNLFYDELRNESLDNTFNYVLKQYDVRKKKKKNIKIEEIEDYKYEVIISMDFDIFEKLIHELLKTKELSKINENYIRYNEYSNLDFDGLLESEKFEPELKTIKDISKEFLTSQYNNLNTTYVFYNPKVTDIFEGFFNNSEENSSSSQEEFDLDGVNNLNDLMEFSEKTESSKLSDDEDDFSVFSDQKLMDISITLRHNKLYKPDSNMIIVSTNFDSSKSRNSSLSLLPSNLSNSINNFNEDDLDLTVDEDKNNVSMQEELNNEDNPLNSSEVNEIKRANKSQIFLDDISDIDKIEKKKNKKEPKNNENIFFIDDESSTKKKKKKKHMVKKERKSYNIKIKRYKGLLKNYYKKNDCSGELYGLFNQEEFMETINSYYPTIFSKALIQNIRIPESRNLQTLDRNYFRYLQKRERKKRISYFKYYKIIIIFVSISFIYFLLLIIFMNVDIWELYFR